MDEIGVDRVVYWGYSMAAIPGLLRPSFCDVSRSRTALMSCLQSAAG
jgi:hypothetical protein